LASLQSKSIQSIQEGDNLVSAAIIAQEVAKRMLSNPYVTSLGRQGYLATDLSGAISSADDVPSWAASTLSSNPNISNCYTATGTDQSCYDPTATVGDSSDHIQALQNMQLLDQVEMRLLAYNTLPEGQIMICFDSSSAYTAFTCDNAASRIDTRAENVFTVKVQWNNLFSNTTQMYAMQFTAQCTDGSSTYCG